MTFSGKPLQAPERDKACHAINNKLDISPITTRNRFYPNAVLLRSRSKMFEKAVRKCIIALRSWVVVCQKRARCKEYDRSGSCSLQPSPTSATPCPPPLRAVSWMKTMMRVSQMGPSFCQCLPDLSRVSPRTCRKPVAWPVLRTKVHRRPDSTGRHQPRP